MGVESMKPAARRRSEVAPAVAALGLTVAAAERFTHRVDQLLRRPRITSLHLRDAVRDAAAVLVVRGVPGARAVDLLHDAVLAHARDRGMTELSLVTREPVAARSALRVARWAAELCAPDHPCLENWAFRRSGRATARRREERPAASAHT